MGTRHSHRALLIDIRELISDAPNGLDVAGLRHIFFDPAPQAPDMDVNRPRLYEGCIPPGMIEDLVSRIYPTRMLGKKSQNLKFRRAEFNFLTIDGHKM